MDFIVLFSKKTNDIDEKPRNPSTEESFHPNQPSAPDGPDFVPSATSQQQRRYKMTHNGLRDSAASFFHNHSENTHGRESRILFLQLPGAVVVAAVTDGLGLLLQVVAHLGVGLDAVAQAHTKPGFKLKALFTSFSQSNFENRVLSRDGVKACRTAPP